MNDWKEATDQDVLMLVSKLVLLRPDYIRDVPRFDLGVKEFNITAEALQSIGVNVGQLHPLCRRVRAAIQEEFPDDERFGFGCQEGKRKLLPIPR